MLIDTHCHLDADEFDRDRDAVIGELPRAGVGAVVVPAYVGARFDHLLNVCRGGPPGALWPALGLHPCYIGQHSMQDLMLLERYLSSAGDIVAVGEIGLDRYVEEISEGEAWERQQYFLQAQLELAISYHKPVLLHVRKAHQEVLGMLSRLRFREGGIVHAFSGGIEEARRYVKLGFRLGIGGALTYDQSKRLRSVVVQMPLESLVLETDAPDMIPRQHRDPVLGGRTRNSPAYLPCVADTLAVLLGATRAEIEAVTAQNAREVLRVGAEGMQGG